MTEIKIKQIEGQNFMSYKDRKITLGDVTEIKGKNRCGKTTSKHLVNWVLINKNADGKAPDGIRPHDKNGVDQDHVEIVGTLLLEIDGREVEIQKVQKQVWRTDRKTKQQRFDGNQNVIYVNGVEKQEKDFKKWFNGIIGEDTYMMCSNARIFFDKSAKERRKILFDMIPAYTNDDVIKIHPEFRSIAESLHTGTPEEVTIEEAMSAVKHRINGKGRSDKGLKGERDAVLVRIDEVSKKIFDTEDDEKEIESLKEEYKELSAEEVKAEDADKVQKAKSDKLLSMKFELSEMERKANEDNISRRTKIDSEIMGLQMDTSKKENELRVSENNLDSCKKGICTAQVELRQAKEDWKTTSEGEFDESELERIKAEEFDPDALICPTCGQQMPKDKADAIREQFEKSKEERIRKEEKKKKDFYELKEHKLMEISSSGNSAAEKLSEYRNKAKEIDDEISDIKKDISSLKLEIENKKKEKSEIPESVDMSLNTKYKKLSGEISALEEEISEMKSPKRDTRIQSRQREIFANISEIQSKIKGSKEAQERVDELKEEHKNIIQKIADAERELDELESFNRKKVEMITDKVNKEFKFVQFRTFRPLVNGDYEECCEVLVNGTSYDRNLNTGDKILAEIDLLSTFQRINEVSVPVFLDSAGEVDRDRIPETDFQLVILRREDLPEMQIDIVK